MNVKLCAFDLDGTLLNSRKELTVANTAALQEMSDSGIVVAFASGRLGVSMRQFTPSLKIDLGMLTLNGAAVYMGTGHSSRQIYDAPLPFEYADVLLSYVKDKPFALNYYHNDRLYAVRNERTARWLDLYYQQTRTPYQLVDSYEPFLGQSPSKVIFIGEEKVLDEQESIFRARWDDSLYICRTWEYYLEFLNPRANKGIGLQALADAYGIPMKNVVAFGDARNDIPMLKRAGMGVAMFNAPAAVKSAASRISPWTNDEDGVAREWELIKASG